ncbi:MAG TPA: GNAT family N-acetyltransferase [Niabella sp.]|nr:GNAT family N-acetyltransferase [Niabella sp.]HQW13769.1 GNAT family N-acetyltransferase [Niabella sp.]HQX19338.1 GNAT family N-acetyltransferase [Niabella sp.]HQX40806.1 GNAT family N-acetyltransferase [Niabella sp.]HRB06108.1 GNAT family N-acetyltransferase [Niabella sp.]
MSKINIFRIDKTQGNLVFELFDKYRVFYKQPSDMTVAQTFIQDRLNNHESVIFVASCKETQQPIGFTQLYPKYSSKRIEKNWILNDLYVEQHYRKKGVGEALINTALVFAQQHNASFVEISTAVDNSTAQSLYEKIGFEMQKPDTEFFTYQIKTSTL